MEVYSVIANKGCTPWQGLLLTASSLTYGCHPTSVRPTIELVPPSVAEGESVLLMVHNLTENLLAFLWYKGVIVFKNHEIARHIVAKNSSVLGPAHSGRETVYSNGSLLLHDVTWKDAGLYTLRTLNRNLKKGLVYVQLLVDTPLSTCCNPLTIEPVPQNAAEGESVLFLVHNLPEDVRTFSWYKGVSSFQIFKMAEYNRSVNSIIPGPVHSRRAMVYANGSLLLQDVIEEDAGFYTLETLNRDLKIETTHVQFHVKPSLVACRNPITSTKLTIESVPPKVVEGENIHLLVHNIPENLRAFSWYKGVAIVNRHAIAWYAVSTNRSLLGPAHSGRETVYPNGSLLLHNVTQKDSGFYTLRTLNTQLETQETRGHIDIYKPVSQPSIAVTDAKVPVQSSVIFTCLSADTRISIRWIVNNQSLQLTERMSMSPTRCRLSIDPVRMEDAGEYKSSLLMCGHLLTTAKVTIEIVPPQVVEGENVLLHVHNLPENLLGLTWFKEITNMNHAIASYEMYHNQAFPGYGHSGRETVYRNGSLWIQNVTQNDSGVYILRGNIRNVERLSSTYIYLHVYIPRDDDEFQTLCMPFKK
ncbi:hypothetical protein STEG23_027532, partial [Scotinomys teguina]